MADLAAELTAELGDELPINLGRIAAKRSVRLIEFRPLLIDGGLSVCPDGFRIFIRTEPEHSAKYTHLFSEDGTGRKLPVPFAKKARYTIAHEIAHTFLFDIDKAPPKPQFRASKGQGTRGLEHACNDTAGILLLPEIAFGKEFYDPQTLLDPGRLISFADSALVSRPLLVTRLSHLKSFPLPVGGIASVALKNGEWRITALCKHYSLRDHFGDLAVGAPVERLIGALTEPFFDGASTCGEQKLGDKIFSCSVERNLDKRGSRASFITLRPI